MSEDEKEEREKRKLRIMRSAKTVATTRYDSTGKERTQRIAPPVSLPRLRCLEEKE